MQKPNAQGEYVWEELDLLLDEQGAPIPTADQQGAALPPVPWMEPPRGGGMPGMMPGMHRPDMNVHHGAPLTSSNGGHPGMGGMPLHMMGQQQHQSHAMSQQQGHSLQYTPHQAYATHHMAMAGGPSRGGMPSNMDFGDMGAGGMNVNLNPGMHHMQQQQPGMPPQQQPPPQARRGAAAPRQVMEPPIPAYLGPELGSPPAAAPSAVVPETKTRGRKAAAAASDAPATTTGRGRGRAKAGTAKATAAAAPPPVISPPALSPAPTPAADDTGSVNNGGVDKDAKRRAAVAAASRATRAKRKRELEELKQKNVKLEKERETFLNTIADLQMKVQALRETGSIDLRMENDLLRAELMEHKSFISKFKHIADGIPTSTSAKKLMCKQGSDTAIAQVLGLLSTSMADPSWRMGVIQGHPELEMRYQRLPHGVSAENAKRCSVRVDLPVIPANDPIEIAQIIWGVWCDEDLNKRISKHFGAVSVSVREIETGIENNMNDVKDSMAGEALRNRVKVYYYREETPRHELDPMSSSQKTDVVDTVLLLSSREKNISRSSFPQDDRFHKFPPDAKAERARFAGKLKPAQTFTLEEQQGLEGQRNYQAIVLASTSTQHSLGLVPVKPGVHRIRSALLEGTVVRKVEGGVAMSSVFSYPSTVEGRFKSNHNLLVTNEGILNEQWTKVICEMHDIVRERMPTYVLDAYRKARNQGVPFHKELTDHL